MTQQKSLKSQFQLDAADKFLTRLAANLVEAIQQKIDGHEVEESPEALGAFVTFTSRALKGMPAEQLRKLDGYAKLNEACRLLDRNACLEAPFPLCDRPGATEGLQIYLQQPYTKSRAAHLQAINSPERNISPNKDHKLWALRQ